jgi:chromosome segregation ATPase
VHQAERDLRNQFVQIQEACRQIEGWKARLGTGASAWEGERERFLADLRCREACLDERAAALAALRERWDRRRRRQILRLRGQRATWEDLRRECAALREEWLRKTVGLNQQQRDLANRALALEQYRQECVGAAPDPATADKRINQLRRHWAALAAPSQRALGQVRRALRAEAGRLDQRFLQLHQYAEELNVRDADLTSRQAAWEQLQLNHQAEQARRERERESLATQRQLYENQLHDLREQVERLARLLLDGGEPEQGSLARAA